MAITSLTIENFKGIGDQPVTVPLRPITLLFGKNSSGKSTILQALHYLREVLENRRPDPDRTQLGGDSIDLGGFYSLVHRHETQDRRIRVRATFSVDADEVPYTGITSPGEITEESRTFSQNINSLTDVEECWIEVVTAQGEKNTVFIAEYAVGINGEELMRLEQPIGLPPRIIQFNFGHPLIRILDQSYAEGTEDPLPLSERMACLYDENYDADSNPFHVYDTPVSLKEQRSLIPPSDQPFWVDDDFTDEQIYQDPETQFAFWSIVGQSLTGPLALLLEELRGIRYTGPIREVPPRNHHSPKTPDESRWARGLGAWDALLADHELTEQTNGYLKEVLNLGYTLNHEDRVYLNRDGDIINEIRLLAARFDEASADEVNEKILKPLENQQGEPVIQLHDEVTDTNVDLYDIGVGVSQVIPVVAGALCKGPKGNRNRIFAVEQPELHVHPAVQVALGDVFIDAVNNSDRMMLIETHSEHLLLRMLRRVRESQETLQPFLLPEQLSVIYVRPTEGGIELTPLDVTQDGDFNEPWPEGFFDERAEELF